MSSDRRRVAISRPAGFQHYDMYKPERDADLKHIRVRTSKVLKEEYKQKMKEIEESQDRGFKLLIHGKKVSEYTPYQKKHVKLSKASI